MTTQNLIGQDKRARRLKTSDGSLWITHRTARTWRQVISTYSDRWSTGCVEKKFKTIEEMRESLEEFFASKDRDWYRHGLTRLEEQWQKVIENNGEYFDY